MEKVQILSERLIWLLLTIWMLFAVAVIGTVLVGWVAAWFL